MLTPSLVKKVQDWTVRSGTHCVKAIEDHADVDRLETARKLLIGQSGRCTRHTFRRLFCQQVPLGCQHWATGRALLVLISPVGLRLWMKTLLRRRAKVTNFRLFRFLPHMIM